FRFIETFPSAAHRFLNGFLSTQAFARSKFVKKRQTPFLDDHSGKERTTFVAPSPDASDLPQKVFKYDVWPVPLKASLFSEPRIIKSLLRSDNGRRRDIQQAKKGFVRAALFERRSSNSNLPNLTSYRYIYSVWFSLLTAICSSKRKSKLLTSAFPVLDRVRQYGIPIDQQCYRELIQSCGKCKSPELA
ncbi:hypothetical protein BVRB_025060, partial [Beta vulgaris subsp. vulgaris]